MTERTQSAHPFSAAWFRAVRGATLLALAAGLAGCHHKAAYVIPPVGLISMDLETPPEPDPPPMIEPLPEDADLVLPEVVPVPPARVVRRRPAAPKDASPAPEVAAADPAPEPSAALAIGELSTGGETTPQSQQQAKELIAAIQKRLSDLPAKTASQQRAQVRQVRYFLKQAQQALQSGDAEGAKNLATKAKLLMDDVEK